LTYDAFETSQESSQPVEVYRFTIGAQSCFYTSSATDKTIAATTYSAVAIKRSHIEEGPDKRDATLRVTVPTPNDVAQLFITSIPGLRVRIEINRYQRLDTPTPEVVRIFDGFVQSCSYTQNMKQAQFSCRPAVATLGRVVPRFKYRAACNHVLYDVGCKVDDTDLAFRASNALVTGVSGNVLTVAGLSGTYVDGWFTGGMVEVVGGTDYRLVLEHVGNDLTLLLPFSVTPSNVTVFAGCDHTIATCKSKFDNVLNFGGFAFVPTKNPFQTGID
jgi:uncharacterized phage protein (TIGR02218 family)